MKKPIPTKLADSTRPNPTLGIQRRQFIKASGGALAAAALATRGIYAADTAPKKLRLGIVGGRFGLQFQFHEHPDCIVEAVSDLRPERRKALMKTYKCEKSYDSLEELVLDKNIDAVAVFTDGPLHVDHTIKAMKNGKHVMTAVPAAWGTLEQADQLRDIVESTGLTYMMAETSYYQQFTISARKMHEQGKFGDLFYFESVYQHDGLESYFFDNGKRTWRYGVAPMHYPTHCTAHLVGVTGERLTEVVCHGWGDDDPVLKDNVYDNPFWNESAMFKTDRGHAFDCRVWWMGAHRGGETAKWVGTKSSFYGPDPNGQGPVIVRKGKQTEKDDAGFVRNLQNFEKYKQPLWWETDMLPEPLRHNSGHQGSHTFLTHEFVDALVHDRRPAIDVYEALAYTVPGIVAHQSALRGGELLKIPQYERPSGG
ncbi:MAG: Gfo/Idh/MocA family oxidoreductase [Planctomycetes bacterium]|nr:Gfo/Idh/MocA family oxidoreductase [Planctomycetota bacterium]